MDRNKTYAEVVVESEPSLDIVGTELDEQFICPCPDCMDQAPTE